MQAAGFPDHDMDALYRHFSDFGNYFREAAGERALLRVAPSTPMSSSAAVRPPNPTFSK
jgi:hypothetical protein